MDSLNEGAEIIFNMVLHSIPMIVAFVLSIFVTVVIVVFQLKGLLITPISSQKHGTLAGLTRKIKE